MARESILLTMKEAVDAVCRDFLQYDPQILLFSQIIQLISKGRIIVKREALKNGAWLTVKGRQNMRWMEGEEMAEYLCEIFPDAGLDAAMLSTSCSMVFHTRATSSVDPDTHQPAIRIETGMEDFFCRQCGQCCTLLDYEKELTADDVSLWEKMERKDLLKWVRFLKKEDGKTEYRIWTIPGTASLAKICPFLEKSSFENRWKCLIQDVKPGICRQYPASRKHAFMTGCTGFKK